MLKNIKESTSQILCRNNAEKYWNSIDDKIKEVFKKLEKEQINKKPDINRKFLQISDRGKARRYELEKEFKKEVNHFRRFQPEMKKGNEPSVVEMEVWNKLWPLIKDSYWKV